MNERIGGALRKFSHRNTVHDDVIDEANTRRGLPSINAGGKIKPQLMGDFSCKVTSFSLITILYF